MARFFVLLLGAAVVGMTCSPAVAVVTTVFQDNFEDDTVGVSMPNAPPVGDYWHPYYSATTPKRYIANNPESEPVNTSTKALFISRLQNMGGDAHSHIQAMITPANQALIETNGNLTIEYKSYDAGGIGDYGGAVLAGYGGPSNWSPAVTNVELRDVGAGEGWIRGTGTPTVSAPWSDLIYQHGTWHQVKIECDWTTETYVISLDGAVQGQTREPYNYPFYHAGTPTINNVLFTAGYWPSYVYIDDLLVTTEGEAPLPLLGDANNDDVVDDKDASALGANWLTGPGATWSMGDFNEDGYVNDMDAAILAAHWQETRTAEGSAVPEPAGVTMVFGLLLGFGVFARFRRR